MNPTFSIIIPCYNQAIYLSDCLNSLIEQSFNEWEAIVVDDGSTDNTKEVATFFSQRDSRIKLAEKNNGGLSSARNAGIKKAIGDRLIFLDADDYLYTCALQEIYIVGKQLDDFTLIQYGYSYITEDKSQLLHTSLPLNRQNLIPDIFYSVPGPCHTICISKKLTNIIGDFDEQLKSLEDWDFWLRAAKAGATKKIISEPLAYYRYVKNSMSRNPFVMFNAFKSVANKAILKDIRINIESIDNRDYNFDNTKVIQEALIRMMGVGIMQNNIDETLELFIKESPKDIAAYEPQEFEIMCSYLTFRYWYGEEDVTMVLEKIKPLFILFFKKAGYKDAFTQRIIFFIFKRHFYYRNIYRYGKFIGSGLNFINRKLHQL